MLNLHSISPGSCRKVTLTGARNFQNIRGNMSLRRDLNFQVWGGGGGGGSWHLLAYIHNSFLILGCKM